MSKTSVAARAYMAVRSSNAGSNDKLSRRMAENQAKLNALAAALHKGRYDNVRAGR